VFSIYRIFYNSISFISFVRVCFLYCSNPIREYKAWLVIKTDDMAVEIELLPNK